MLLYQRIDYSPPVPGQNLYVRIPLTSTLWTVIEKRGSDDERESGIRSPVFPSRIIRPNPNENSIVFAGIEIGGLLRQQDDPLAQYRLQWRTVADPEDTDHKDIIALPLGKDVTITFSHGNSSLLQLSVGGIDIVLDYNLTTRILSTSWFIPAYTTSWTLGIPKMIMNKLITGNWSDTPSQRLLAPPEEETDGCCFKQILLHCISRAATSLSQRD